MNKPTKSFKLGDAAPQLQALRDRLAEQERSTHRGGPTKATPIKVVPPGDYTKVEDAMLADHEAQAVREAEEEAQHPPIPEPIPEPYHGPEVTRVTRKEPS